MLIRSSVARRARAALVVGSLLALAGTAAGQITGPTILASTDPTGGTSIQVYSVATGSFTGSIPATLRLNGMAYDQTARRVYILARGTSATQSVLHTLDVSDTSPAVGPTLVANVSGAATNITSGGLAWDGANSRGIATFAGRVFSLDPTTAVLTEIRNFSTTPNFNGADIDPVTGSLYLLNSSGTVSGAFTGRGVYKIDPPFESSPIVKIANYPLKAGVPETDIDGLAAGNGVLYLTTDETQSLYRLRLSDMTYLAAIDQPWGPSTTGALVGGAAYVGSAAAGADLGVAIINDVASVVPTVGQWPFVVTLRNVGSATATGVVAQVPLPVGTSFVSATGGATFGSGVVTLNAGDLTPGQGVSFQVTLSAAAAFTLTANGTTTATDVLADNNSASVFSGAGAPDVAMTLTAPANCTATAGSPVAFTANVINGGPRAADTVLTFPLPAGAMFASSTPAGVNTSGTVTINLGTLAAGASVPVTINVIPGDGLLLRLAANVSTPGETNLSDNSATAATTTALFSAAPIRALLSTVPSASNSTFPGLVGSLVGTSTLDSVRSSNGQFMVSHWSASVNLQDDLIVRTNLATGVSSVAGQEGTTALPGGFIPFFNTFGSPGVNDSGDFALSGRNNDVAATDKYAVKSIGGTLFLTAREGQIIPALPSFTYGDGLSGTGMTNSGKSVFIASVVGAPAGQDEAAFAEDGTVLVASRGTTTPANAAGPITDILNTGYYVSADGNRYIYQATTTVGGSKTNAVVGTVGGTDATAIVVQGSTLPGFSSPVTSSGIDVTLMTPEGRWFVRGSNADGEDWIISGTGNTVTPANIVMRTGPGTSTTPLVVPSVPIFPGSSERWDPSVATAPSSNLIIANASNPRGDVVVVGETDADDRSDVVFVLNGTTVIAREGDPVDANNNGVFDDDLFIRGLGFDDTIVMTNDAVFAVVSLRDRNGVCTNASTTAASALVRIPLPAPAVGLCCRGTTCTIVAPASCAAPVGVGISQPGGSTCNANGVNTSPCCYADFDKNGVRSIDDIFIYLNAWFAPASNPFCKIAGDGVAGANIDDLFVFINVWFAGGCG